MAGRRAAQPLDVFVGRDDELLELERLSATSRLVTVLGPPGIGKTRLARAFAARPMVPFAFVELERARTAGDVLGALAAALDVRLGDEHELGALLTAAGAEKCLVLDNAEQVAGALAPVLGELLGAAAALRLVVTSRERLGLPGEQTMPLGPLDRGDAVALFEARARERSHDYATAPEHEPLVGDIVERLDRIPLAIELAAAQTPVFALPALARRLEQDLVVLRSDRRGVSERQATLDGAVDWSWRLLDDADRRALARCSFFEAPFPFEAGEAAIEEQGEPATSRLRGLIARSLLRTVSVEGLGGERWLANYVAVRDFVRRKVPADDIEGGRRSIEGQLLDVTEVDDRALVGLSLRAPDLRRVVERALDAEDGPVAAQALSLLGRVVSLRGPATSTLALAQRAVDITAGAERLLVLRTRAQLCLRAGDLVAAEADLADALEAQPQMPAGQHSELLADLATVYRRMERLEDAERSYRQVLEGASDQLRRRVLTDLGGLLHEQNRIDEAHAVHLEALDACQRTQDRFHEGVVLQNLGILEQERGELDIAERRFSEALDLHRDVGHVRFEGVAHCDLASLSLERAAPRAAADSFAVGLELLEQVGDRREALLAGALRAVADAMCAHTERARIELAAAARDIRERGFDELQRALELHRGHQHLALGLAALREGDASAYEGAVETTRALAHVEGESTGPDEVRFARRLLRAALAHHEDLDAALLAAPDGRWFRALGVDAVDLSRRETLRRIVSALLDLRLRRPDGGLTQADLLAAGWPDERMLPDAAKNRVQVALTQLRKLGLAGALVRDPDRGYRLDPSVPLLLCGP